MSEEFKELIKDQELLKGLTEEQAVKFANSCEIRAFETKDKIIRTGELTTEMYLLVEGQCNIEVDVTDEVKHFVVEHLAEGDIFGEMSFLDGSPRSATVVSVTQCKVLVISPKAFEELLKDAPEITTSIMKNIAILTARKMRKTHQRLKNLYWKGQVSN
jgi:CRP/FNR family transcriptional regulator/CRP/FNR family cyclic AMP-dependent transcriptional regulator